MRCDWVVGYEQRKVSKIPLQRGEVSIGTGALQDFLKNQWRQSDDRFRLQNSLQYLDCRSVSAS